MPRSPTCRPTRSCPCRRSAPWSRPASAAHRRRPGTGPSRSCRPSCSRHGPPSARHPPATHRLSGNAGGQPSAVADLGTPPSPRRPAMTCIDVLRRRQSVDRSDRTRQRPTSSASGSACPRSPDHQHGAGQQVRQIALGQWPLMYRCQDARPGGGPMSSRTRATVPPSAATSSCASARSTTFSR